MRILGIDPGAAITGFGLIEQDSHDQFFSLQYGVITTSSGLPVEQRLLIIFQEISKIILLHQPETAAVEKLFFQRNVSSAMAVGQARGVVLLALAQAGIPFQEYTPNEVKQSVTGYGSADKGQIQEMVKMLLRLEKIPKPDDAADALAIALCHANMNKWKQLAK